MSLRSLFIPIYLAFIIIIIFSHIAISLIWLPFSLISFILIIPIINEKTNYLSVLCVVTYLAMSNILISILSNYINNKIMLNFFQGYNFFLVIEICFFVYLKYAPSYKLHLINKSNIITVLFLIVIVIYSFYGLKTTNIKSVMIYLRFFFYPSMMYFLGNYFGKKLSYRKIITPILLFAVFCTIISFIEFLIPEIYYKLVHAAPFYSLKYSEKIDTAYDMVKFRSKRFFNLVFFRELRTIRTNGLIFHSITSGYWIAIGVIILYVKQKYFLMLFTLIGIFLCGAKGAILSIFVVFFLGFITDYGKKRMFLEPIIIISYIGIIVFVGINSNDPHLLKLIMAIYSFPYNPLGKGIGYGGVLSDARTLEFASGDTALGTMLSQFGMSSMIIYLFYFHIISIYRNKTKGNKIWCYGTFGMLLLVNSIFQEEAFSPYSMGLIMLMMGGVISSFSINENCDRYRKYIK